MGEGGDVEVSFLFGPSSSFPYPYPSPFLLLLPTTPLPHFSRTPTNTLLTHTDENTQPNTPPPSTSNPKKLPLHKKHAHSNSSPNDWST